MGLDVAKLGRGMLPISPRAPYRVVFLVVSKYGVSPVQLRRRIRRPPNIVLLSLGPLRIGLAVEVLDAR